MTGQSISFWLKKYFSFLDFSLSNWQDRPKRIIVSAFSVSKLLNNHRYLKEIHILYFPKVCVQMISIPVEGIILHLQVVARKISLKKYIKLRTVKLYTWASQSSRKRERLKVVLIHFTLISNDDISCRN